MAQFYPTDTQVSPGEALTSEFTQKALNFIEEFQSDLEMVTGFDQSNTSSEYQLRCSRAKDRLLERMQELPTYQEKVVSKKFPIYTVAELNNIQEPPWLVDKLIPRTGVGILYAGSRQLKSFASIGIAGAITNQATLGGYTVTENRRVAFGLLEGFSGFKTRIAAYQKIVDPSFDPLTMNLSGFSLKEKEDRDEVISHCLTYDIGFLTIDTYSKASIGVNENLSNETAEVIAGAEEIANTAKCCVLLIDHTGKDVERGVRGSSAKFANVDFVFAQKRSAEHITLSIQKEKDAEDDFEMHFGIATQGEFLAIDCSQQKRLSLQQEVDQGLANGEDEKDLKARLVADGYKDGSVRSAIFRSKKNATNDATE